MSSIWNAFKIEYSNRTSLPAEIIELIAVKPILLQSVEGFSNSSIARKHNTSVEYVESILVKYLNFTGWENNLDFSPIATFNTSKDNFSTFSYEINMYSNIKISEGFLNICFNVCKRYQKLKEILTTYGY